MPDNTVTQEGGQIMAGTGSSGVLIDITTTIQDGMVHWPGDIDVSLNKSNSIKNGDDYNLTSLSMSAHTSTHMDAPLHFIDGGKSISEIPLDAVIGKAKVIYIDDENVIKVEELKRHEIKEGDRIIFKTLNSAVDWCMKDFTENYIYISNDAAKYLADKKIKTVGIDYLSVSGMDNGVEVHNTLLGAGIWIIEGLALKDVEPGEYELICLPLKLLGSDGSPARAVLKII